MNNIEKAIKFLHDSFDQSDYFTNHPLDKQYRLEHTYRVANIGKEIASNEDLSYEGLVVGCILHDVGYMFDFETNEEYKEHGRKGANYARDFVNTLDLDQETKDSIIYGISIHVDGKSDFEGVNTVLAETISECDNIDRFDAYRLYEFLKYSKLDEMTNNEQIEFCDNRIKRLDYIKENFIHKTKTSQRLWTEKLNYQYEYVLKLRKQLLTSTVEGL